MNNAYRFLAGLLLAGGMLTATQGAFGQTSYTWTGAVSGNWGTAGNWSPQGVPNDYNNAIGVFGASTRTAVSVNAADWFKLYSLTFGANAPAYIFTIGGGTSALLITTGIVNDSHLTHPSFVIATNNSLAVYGGSLANSYVTNAGEVLIDGPSSGGTAIIHNLSGGLFDFHADRGNPNGDALTIINDAGGRGDVGGASIGSLSGAGGANIGFDALTLGQLNRNDVISGTLDGSGGGALNKVGTGTLTLSGANTYTGPTSIHAGTLQVDGSLSPASAVDVSSDGHSILSGAGIVGDVTVEPGASLRPGNASPGTALVMNSLSCDPNYGADVLLRLGNDSGGHTHGTQMFTLSPLIQANCARLKVIFSSASVPLAVGTPYLIAQALSPGTDYTPANLTYDFHGFPGYSQASGHFTILSQPGLSRIFFTLDSPGDKIFSNGFEPLN